MINLVKNVTDTIAAFRKNEEDYIAAMNKALEPYKSPALQQRYTQKGLHQAILEDMTAVKTEWLRTDKVFNQLLNNQIQEAKKKLIVPEPKKDADYSLKISNALRFLELEGNNLTDEIAYSILKDFTEDLHQMQLFERVVMRLLKDGYEEVSPLEMHRNFPKTFGKLHKNQFILNTFNEMEALAENLFIRPKVEGPMIRIGLNCYATLMSGAAEISDEADLINLAKIIEKTIEPKGRDLSLPQDKAKETLFN